MSDVYNVMDLRALVFLVAKSDSPTFDKAMSGPDADGYWAAMESEVGTLVSKYSWIVLDSCLVG